VKDWERLVNTVTDVDVRWDVPASRLNTFRVGGTVRCVARPRTEDSLKTLLKTLKAEGLPWTIVGNGSNVLFPDGAWDHMVILLDRCATRLEYHRRDDRSGTLRVGSGLKLTHLLKLCIRHGWTGLEFLAGIPATVGGAVVMNAGTRDGAVGDVLERVRLLDETLRERTVSRSELSMGYRSGGLPPGAVVLEADFRVRLGLPRRIAGKVAGFLRERRQSQPARWPSAGCVFKNPPGLSAGALIDQAGFKGYRVGDAEVSPVHANWIVNRGRATRADVLEVIRTVRHGVRERFGVDLELEVRVLE